MGLGTLDFITQVSWDLPNYVVDGIPKIQTWKYQNKWTSNFSINGNAIFHYHSIALHAVGRTTRIERSRLRVSRFQGSARSQEIIQEVVMLGIWQWEHSQRLRMFLRRCRLISTTLQVFIYRTMRISQRCCIASTSTDTNWKTSLSPETQSSLWHRRMCKTGIVTTLQTVPLVYTGYGLAEMYYQWSSTALLTMLSCKFTKYKLAKRKCFWADAK